MINAFIKFTFCFLLDEAQQYCSISFHNVITYSQQNNILGNFTKKYRMEMEMPRLE